jgi:hypothetical protein
MNFDFDIVMILAVFTLGGGLLWGITSYMRAKKAEDHHEGAAVADRQAQEGPDAPPEGTPGGIEDPRVRVRDGHTEKHGIAAPNDSGRSWSEDRGANPPTPIPPRN